MVSTTTVSNVWPTFAVEDSSGLEVRTMMTLPSGSTRRCAGSAATAKSVIPQARDFVLVDVIAEGLLTTHNDERCLHSGQHGSFRLMLCAVDRRRDVPSVTEGTGVGRWWPCSHC